MDNSLEQLVRSRAGDACECCRMPQAFVRPRHQVDHVVARQHGGATLEKNLALCCLRCNLHKGPNIAGVGQRPNRAAVQSAPRCMGAAMHGSRDAWDQHFAWQGAIVVGTTPAGRATVAVLAMNDPQRVALRQSLLDEGVFPLNHDG